MWGTTLVVKRVEVTKECHVLSLLHSPRIACLAGSALESDLLSVAVSVPLVTLCPGDRADTTRAKLTGPEAAAIAHREWFSRVAKAGLTGCNSFLVRSACPVGSGGSALCTGPLLVHYNPVRYQG